MIYVRRGRATETPVNGLGWPVSFDFQPDFEIADTRLELVWAFLRYHAHRLAVVRKTACYPGSPVPFYTLGLKPLATFSARNIVDYTLGYCVSHDFISLGEPSFDGYVAHDFAVDLDCKTLISTRPQLLVFFHHLARIDRKMLPVGGGSYQPNQSVTYYDYRRDRVHTDGCVVQASDKHATVQVRYNNNKTRAAAHYFLVMPTVCFVDNA